MLKFSVQHYDPPQRKPIGNTLVQSLDRFHNFLRIDILEIRIVAIGHEIGP